MRPRPTPNPAPLARRGFTLLELIISVALVLVLMLAITKIFSITSTTIGASQAFAAATRDARGAQAVFAHDIGSMASDSPFIWIRYDPPVGAFRNPADAAGDKDYVAGTQTTTGLATNTGTPNQTVAKRTIDVDDDGVEGGTTPGEVIGDLGANNRSHRQDRFSFCARDRFYRQTGNTTPNTIVAGQSSPEAWITYGHLTLPNSSGQFFLTSSTGGTTTNLTNPGDGTEQNNAQNFYASQWVLGRVAQVMVLPTGAPSASPAGEYINDGTVSQEYYSRDAGAGWTTADVNMTPLADSTLAHAPYASVQLNHARYDLVGIDIANAKDRIERHLLVENATATASTTPPWYANMLATRFRVNPFVVKPIDAVTASQQVPTFIPACSQFIVEYAGDFVTQNADGSLNTTAAMGGLTPDGEVDFHYDTGTGSRQIQWFGYPRSQTGSLSVDIGSGDTCFVGDFVHYITGKGKTSPGTSPYTRYSQLTALNPDFASFEKFSSTTGTDAAAAATAKDAYRFPTSDTYSAAPPGGTVYAAWAPDSINNPKIPRPKMFRITLTIDRPEMAGRTESGQTFEYVFNAP